MRIMPFMKRKNGVQFAGVGLDTGGGGGGGGGSRLNFSTEETVVGTFMGKPLYAIVLTRGEDASIVDFNVRSLGIDKIVNLFARCIDNVGNEIYTIKQASGDYTIAVRSEYSGNIISSIRAATNNSICHDLVLTICYTKYAD